MFSLDRDAELVGCGGGDETELDLEGAVGEVDLGHCDEGCRIEGYGHGLVACEVEVCPQEVKVFVHFGLGGADFGDDDSFVEGDDLRGS